MKNTIGGEVHEVSVQDLIENFSGEARTHLEKLAKEAETQVENVADDGLVLFENLDFCSSQFGDRSALVCGPLRTYTIESACAGRLGDVPSRFKYPVKFCRFKKRCV